MKLKMFWQAPVALVMGLALAFTLAGCPTDAAPAGPDDIGWNAIASGSPASNAIVLLFNYVPTGLLATDISITAGTGSATRGALTGTGREWTLTVTDVSAGTVFVYINRTGISTRVQSVTLVAPPTGGNDNDTADNGNVTGGRLFAQAPPILPSAIPIDLSEITDWMGRDTVVDRAVAYVNANPGIFTLVLDDDIDVSGSRQLNTANVNLTVIGNGERTIRQAESGSIFDVGIVLATAETNISLTLGENVILAGRQGNTVAAVTVRGGATLTMQDNAIITGNTAGTGIIGDASGTGLGGGVFMQGVPGGGIATTFTMRDNAWVHGNSRSTRGGGVFVDENAVLNMYDNATVSSNSITAGFQRDGGGVYVGGIFNMHGGTISGNTAGMFGGGGVHVGSRGTFVMSGGTVYGNDVPAPLANDASSGAALLLGSSAPVTSARFGDGTNILPHTDGNSRHTNNTITGRLTAHPPGSHMVTFNTHGGSPVETQTVQDGRTATRPAQNPTRGTDTFVDWFTAETDGSAFNFDTPITANTTIHARWTVQAPTYHTVTFNTGGGTPVPDSQEVREGNTARRPAVDPTRASHTFEGWYTCTAFTTRFDFATPVTASITLFAGWEPDNDCGNLVCTCDTGEGVHAYLHFERRDGGYFVLGRRYVVNGTSNSAVPASVIIPAVRNGLPIIGIGTGAFAHTPNLTTIEIPASVTYIGISAFVLSGIETVTFAPGSQLESIGAGAFSSTTYLTAIKIPANVTYIGINAFDLSGIETVTFAPDIRLESISQGTFRGTSNLAAIEIPAGVTYIEGATGPQANNGTFFHSGIQTITFAPGSRLESIGRGAFGMTTYLAVIKIPAGVTYIGNHAFSSSGIETVTFAPGSQLESIGSLAFQNTPNLTTIEIPASVIYIGSIAFRHSSIETIYIHHNTLNPPGWESGWRLANNAQIWNALENPPVQLFP